MESETICEVEITYRGGETAKTFVSEIVSRELPGLIATWGGNYPLVIAGDNTLYVCERPLHIRVSVANPMDVAIDRASTRIVTEALKSMTLQGLIAPRD